MLCCIFVVMCYKFLCASGWVLALVLVTFVSRFDIDVGAVFGGVVALVLVLAVLLGLLMMLVSVTSAGVGWRWRWRCHCHLSVLMSMVFL